jgi:hypothetical protein
MFGIFKTNNLEYKKAQNAQRELTVAFDAISMNFMDLDPVVHGALLKEAMALGAEKAVANFIKLVGDMGAYDKPIDGESMAKVLREIYRARAEQIDAASR